MLPLANTAVLGRGAVRTTPGISDETALHYASVSLEYRMKMGQFYTPKHLIEKMLTTINIPKDSRILEPTFGSGDMIRVLLEKGYTNITGIELDAKFFTPDNQAKWRSLGVDINNTSALTFASAEKFDLVFSNPPYEGDLYAQILLHMITLTKPGGLLSFLIPTSLMNGISFQKYRNAIHKSCNIERLYVHNKRDEFVGADVEVMILQLRKTTPSMDFCKTMNNKLIFIAEKNAETAAEGVSKTSSDKPCKYISDLVTFSQGKVDTSKIKTDKDKEMLSETKTADNLLFIQAFNISNSGLQTTAVRKGRKQYLARKYKPDVIAKAPFIVVKHTIGNEKKFVCMLIREGEYYTEHHTIIGRAKSLADLEKAYETLSDTEYMNKYIKVYSSRSIAIGFLNDVCIKE